MPLRSEKSAKETHSVSNVSRSAILEVAPLVRRASNRKITSFFGDLSMISATIRRFLVTTTLGVVVVPSTAFAENGVGHRILAVDNGHAIILNAKGEVEWEVPVR